MIDAPRRCIYHMRPQQMAGTVLRPLNQLKSMAPDVYHREIAKYNDHPSRQQLPGIWLPELDCRWNDVIHCSSVHPHLLYREWQQHFDEVNSNLRVFGIPIGAVADLSLAIMQPSSGDGQRDITPVTADQYIEITEVPDETRRWYARLGGKGRFGAHFVGVPHVLVRGSIDTRGLRLLQWSEPRK